jgi:hypothetical protein
MEDDCRNEKDSEEEYLDEETSDNYSLSDVQQLESSRRLYSSPHRLYEERHAIPGDEYFREPLQSNYRMSFAVDQFNNASEDQIYGNGEERWSDQDEQCLYD